MWKMNEDFETICDGDVQMETKCIKDKTASNVFNVVH